MFIVPVVIEGLFLVFAVVLSDGFTDDSERLLIRCTDILHLNDLVCVYLELLLQFIYHSLVDFIFLALSGDFSSQYFVYLVFSVGLSQLLAQRCAFIADGVSLTHNIVHFEL